MNKFKIGDKVIDIGLICIVTKVPWLASIVEVQYPNGGKNWVEKKDLQRYTKLHKALK